MSEEKKYWPKANNKPRFPGRYPDRTKCAEQKSKQLEGSTPGGRGACEKESEVQGSE
jgi:hypothetical protein